MQPINTQVISLGGVNLSVSLLISLLSVSTLSHAMPTYQGHTNQAITNQTQTNPSYQSHQSQESYQGATDDTTYMGLKGGMLFIDDSANIQEVDNPIMYGGYVGYQFNKRFGVEVDYTVSKKADVVKTDDVKGAHKMANYGSYITYHHPIANGSVYAKSKLGIGGTEVDEMYGDSKQSFDDVGVAGGVGIGIHLNNTLAMETEFNMLRSDTIESDRLTVGAHLKF